MGSLPFSIPYQNAGLQLTGMGDGPGGSPNFLTSSWDSISNWFTGKNADTSGMSPSLAQTMQTGQSLKNVGLVTSVLQGVNSAIGTFYAAKSQQYQERSQASNLAFQGDMAAINASREEMTAQSIAESGKSQIASYTMQAGQQKAGAVASMAARGIALGVGSAADVSASMDIEKSLNVLAINKNSTMREWAAREQGTNDSNQALLDRTSSASVLRGANLISPVAGTVNSLLGSATQIAGKWDYNQWLRMKLAQGLPSPQLGTIGS